MQSRNDPLEFEAIKVRSFLLIIVAAIAIAGSTLAAAGDFVHEKLGTSGVAPLGGALILALAGLIALLFKRANRRLSIRIGSGNALEVRYDGGPIAGSAAGRGYNMFPFFLKRIQVYILRIADRSFLVYNLNTLDFVEDARKRQDQRHEGQARIDALKHALNTGMEKKFLPVDIFLVLLATFPLLLVAFAVAFPFIVMLT